MRKFLTATVMGLIVFGLTACGHETNTLEGVPKVPPTVSVEPPTLEIEPPIGELPEVDFDIGVLSEVTEFGHFKGTVDEIKELGEQDFKVVVRSEDVGGYSTAIHVMGNFETTFIDGIYADAEVVVVFRVDGPMIMIYPPQHQALAILNSETTYEVNFVVGRFDEELVNAENTHRLNITEETEVLLQDGTPFNLEYGGLGNRALIAFYDISTRSIPAQINPRRVIVFFDQALHLPIDIGE